MFRLSFSPCVSAEELNDLHHFLTQHGLPWLFAFGRTCAEEVPTWDRSSRRLQISHKGNAGGFSAVRTRVRDDPGARSFYVESRRFLPQLRPSCKRD